MKHINHTPVRISAALAAILTLSACQFGGSNGLRLPQGYRIASDPLADFFEPRSGKIAVAHASGNLVVVDQTGANPIEITRDAGARLLRDRSGALQQLYTTPIWSPDATQLVVIETRASFPLTYETSIQGNVAVQGQAAPGSEIVESSLAGSAPRENENSEEFSYQARRVTVEFGGQHVSSALYTVEPNGKSALKEVLFSDVPIEFADWSPTGDQIGVLTSGQDGESLMVMNADGNSRLSLGTGVAMNWSWNPDGQTVVAQTRLSPQSLRADVKIHATDNGEELSSVASREDSTLSGVHYSPDGNFMVTARRKEGGEALDAELYIVDRDGKVVRKLTSVSGLVTYAWSPAGAMLAYVERESAGSLGGTLRVLDVNTGEAKTLTSQPVTGIFWSPDAKTVAAFGPLQRGLVDPSGNILNLTSEQSQVVMLAQTINVTTGEARPLFYIEPTARFLSVLVQFDRYSRAMTIWAPNSKRLLVPIRYGDGTQSGDLVIESESSGSIFPRLVAPGSMASWSPK